MFDNLSSDIFSSEYRENGVLCISCGTPDRLTEEVLKKRIQSAVEKSGAECTDVEICGGFDTLKKTYESDFVSCGTLSVKIGDEERDIAVKLFLKEIIYDHDLGSDVDDGGAAAMLIKAHRDGYCKVLAITSCVFNPYASYCIKEICEYFGVNDIDIGVNTERDTLKSWVWWRSSYKPAVRYYSERGKAFPTFESNCVLFRKKLAESKGQLTFISTGALTDLLALFQTEGDSISPLDGCTLFRDKVDHYVCGGGNFPSGRSENNFLCDPEAVDLAVNKYLAGFPITFVGAEVCGIVYSGSVMKRSEHENYILRQIYETWKPDDCNHNSWDLGVMHYSLFGTSSGYFSLKKGFTVKPYGTKGEMTLEEGGCHEYVVREASPDALTPVFNEWLLP